MRPSLFAREDTLLGVCEGLGEELGVNPLVFRVAFALGLFWSLEATIAGYLMLGALLALFRWAFPLRRAAADPVTAAPAPLRSDNDDIVAARADAA